MPHGGFTGSHGRFETMVSWLNGDEAAALTHSEWRHDCKSTAGSCCGSCCGSPARPASLPLTKRANPSASRVKPSGCRGRRSARRRGAS